MAPEAIDPQALVGLIVERVVERGSQQDWAARLAYYGKERGPALARNHLSDRTIAVVCWLSLLGKAGVGNAAVLAPGFDLVRHGAGLAVASIATSALAYFGGRSRPLVHG